MPTRSAFEKLMTALPPKRVAEVVPGDRVVVVRTVVEVRRSPTAATVVYDDGSRETFDLAGNPTVAVAG